MTRRPRQSESSIVRLARKVARASEEATSGEGIDRHFDHEKFLARCRALGVDPIALGYRPTATEEMAAIEAEPLLAPDDRPYHVGDLLCDFEPGASDQNIDIAGFSIHRLMVRLVESRRVGGFAVRRTPSGLKREWSPQSRSTVVSLRRLGDAAATGDSYRWIKAWGELPQAAEALLMSQAGGFLEFARVPTLPDLPFPVPYAADISPLIPGAIERAGAPGRPRELVRDLTVIEILRILAGLQGHPDQPPEGWSTKEHSAFRDLVVGLEGIYNELVPGEAAEMQSGGRGSLRIGSSATLTRLVAEAFGNRTQK
ncbi:hypothetical protein V5F49_14340 [Xanthobacter sp. V3C-3]|uniref:hypothetical protein n=1 Tax=Xanthobacter lutulentifluminis TaxID=3119935 RepID=UPI0037285B79